MEDGECWYRCGHCDAVKIADEEDYPEGWSNPVGWEFDDFDNEQPALCAACALERIGQLPLLGTRLEG